MKKDVKTIDQLLNQIQTIRADVHDYHVKTERLMSIKDSIIDVLEKQKAIYKHDLNIMFWIVAILSISLIFVFISTLI